MYIICKYWVFFSALLMFFGCSDESAETDYIVTITVVGKAEAFANRTIKIIDQTLGPLGPVIDGQIVTDELQAEVRLCTKNRDKFVDEPISITVLEGEQIVSQQLVNRIACKYSRHEVGNQELNWVYLELDGSIDAEFGNSENVWADCGQPNYSLSCQGEPDF